jgi:hypothetical protein
VLLIVDIFAALIFSGLAPKSSVSETVDLGGNFSGSSEASVKLSTFLMVAAG